MTVLFQIKCCLQEWASGELVNIPFTVEAFSHDNDRILDAITQVKAHSYHGPSYRDAKSLWAKSGKCVALLTPSRISFICINMPHPSVYSSETGGVHVIHNVFKVVLD
jgi:hypothetical protein